MVNPAIDLLLVIRFIDLYLQAIFSSKHKLISWNSKPVAITQSHNTSISSLEESKGWLKGEITNKPTPATVSMAFLIAPLTHQFVQTSSTIRESFNSRPVQSKEKVEKQEWLPPTASSMLFRNNIFSSFVSKFNAQPRIYHKEENIAVPSWLLDWISHPMSSYLWQETYTSNNIKTVPIHIYAWSREAPNCHQWQVKTADQDTSKRARKETWKSVKNTKMISRTSVKCEKNSRSSESAILYKLLLQSTALIWKPLISAQSIRCSIVLDHGKGLWKARS